MIQSMNDPLPEPQVANPTNATNPINPTNSTNNTNNTNTGTVQVSTTGVSGREKEVGNIAPQELQPVGSGVEIELPKEVAGVGVKSQPTVVSLPPNISQMGVKQIGANVSPTPPPAVSLPLTDDQISQGLHQSVLSSWRWLAEWCVRKLRQFGFKK